MLPHTLKSRTAFTILAAVLMIGFSVVLTAAQADDKAQLAVELFNQGQDAHEKGDVTAALGFYVKALELLPDFPEAELQRGNALVSLKRPEEAEQAYRKALELREDWTLAMSNLGSLLVQRGKYEEAEKLLAAALAADSSNQSAFAAVAEMRLRTNAADPFLRDILSKLSAFASGVRPSPAVLSMKAAIELKLKDVSSAKATARRGLDQDPKSVWANLILAEVALIERDTALTETYIRGAETAGGVTADTKRLRAMGLAMQGKKAEALALLETISAPSESVAALISELKEGDVADLTGLEAKVQRTPDDVNALDKLCRGYRLTAPLKAIEYCRRASTLEPNEMSHAINFGAALVQAKQYDQAAGLFRKLLTIAPENATIRANLGTALFQLKRYAEAKPEFRWLTEKQPESATAYYFLGIVHDQLGEYLDAIANYQQFLRLADTVRDKLDIERVNLRMPAVQKLAKDRKNKKSG